MIKVRLHFCFFNLIIWSGLVAQKQNVLPDTIRFCIGDSASITIKNDFHKNATITWSTPTGTISNTRKVKVIKPGRYLLRISSPRLVASIIDSSYVKIYEKPVIKLRDTTLCKGKSIILDAGNPGMKYLWNTKETSQKIKAEEAGTYWVKISNGNCLVIDTVVLKPSPNTGLTLNTEKTFCLNEENRILHIKPAADTKILWNSGATTSSITVSKEGTYWVYSDSKQCGAQTDTVKVKFKACECEMIIPNSFTPNDDNRNDYFFPYLQCEYSHFTITVTDRWGNTVYNSNNINARWDGRYKGVPCPEDIYVYRIESTEKGSDKKQVRNGHISLFR